MANMDYPGPCPNCSAIDGCASEAIKKDSVVRYCKGLEMELNAWKAQLYDIISAADEIKGNDQEKLADTLTLIKVNMRELEAIKEQMLDTCPSSVNQEKVIGAKLEELRNHYSEALKVFSPGWLGG